MITHEFDAALPIEVKQASRLFGNEWLIPLQHVGQCIDVASTKGIAVLGLEILKILDDGMLGTENYSGYEVKDSSEWQRFVRENNKHARDFIEKHRFGEGYGYILTTTSQEEFRNLRVSNA